MAVEIGTASNYVDLLSKLITFLTTNASLVAAGQEWEVLGAPEAVTGPAGQYSYLLRGPGLAELDQIHVRLATASAAGSDVFGMSVQGFVSYNPTLSHNNQPGISAFGGMALWNSAIPYWFIANGRRFIVIAKVSTTYTSMYAGFYLPYATPSEFPYPIFIAGSHEDPTTHRWSQSDHNVGGFWDPSNGNAYLRHNDGTWLTFANYEAGSGNSRNSYSDSCIWPYDSDLLLRENIGGSYTMLPCVLHSTYSSGNVYGELDGVFFTSGFGVGSEDTITKDGDTYLIVQSVYRTDRLSYCAIKLS